MLWCAGCEAGPLSAVRCRYVGLVEDGILLKLVRFVLESILLCSASLLL